MTSTLMPDVSRLPAGAQRLVELIGLPQAMLLVERHGGKMLRLYPNGGMTRRLAAALGEESTAKLLTYFGSDPFTVPKCTDAMKEIRNAQIHAEFDRLTKQEQRSARESVHVIVDIFQISERQAWRIFKTATPRLQEPRRTDPRQIALF